MRRGLRRQKDGLILASVLLTLLGCGKADDTGRYSRETRLALQKAGCSGTSLLENYQMIGSQMGMGHRYQRWDPSNFLEGSAIHAERLEACWLAGAAEGGETDEEGRSVVVLAAVDNNFEVLKLLLEKVGLDPQLSGEGQPSPLAVMVEKKNREFYPWLRRMDEQIIEILEDHGATAPELFRASDGELLEEAPSCPEDILAAFEAQQLSQYDLRICLEGGTDPRIETAEGRSLLYEAVAVWNLPMVQLLIEEYRLHPDWKGSQWEGATPLGFSLAFRSRGVGPGELPKDKENDRLEIIQTLINNGANLEWPLGLSISGAVSIAEIRELLDAGAQTHFLFDDSRVGSMGRSRGQGGRSLMNWAVAISNANKVEMLLNYGAPVAVQDVLAAEKRWQLEALVEPLKQAWSYEKEDLEEFPILSMQRPPTVDRETACPSWTPSSVCDR